MMFPCLANARLETSFRAAFTYWTKWLKSEVKLWPRSFQRSVGMATHLLAI